MGTRVHLIILGGSKVSNLDVVFSTSNVVLQQMQNLLLHMECFILFINLWSTLPMSSAHSPATTKITQLRKQYGCSTAFLAECIYIAIAAYSPTAVRSKQTIAALPLRLPCCLHVIAAYSYESTFSPSVSAGKTTCARDVTTHA